MYCVVPFKNDVPSFFLLLSHSLQRYEESTLLDLHMRSLERDNGTNKKIVCKQNEGYKSVHTPKNHVDLSRWGGSCFEKLTIRSMKKKNKKHMQNIFYTL